MKLVLKNVYKSYKINKSLIKPILFNFSYSFESNNIYLVVGESGRGKSTLFNTISLMSPVDNGELYLDSLCLTKLNYEEINNYRKNYLSYSMQLPYFLDALSVKDNIFKTVYDIDENKFLEYARLLKVDNILEKRMMDISGGEKQRINLLSALLKPSKILLLDEPTSSLDEDISKVFISLLNEVKKDKIVIISSHNLELFDDHVDYIVELDEDKLLDENYPIKTTINLEKNDNDVEINCFERGKILINHVVFAIVLIMITSFLIAFKNHGYDYILNEITNYPTLNQFTIKNSEDLAIENTFDSFPIGNQVMNDVFDNNPYVINNTSIYMFRNNFVKYIKEGHVYISNQLANAIATYEQLDNKNDVIGKSINVVLYSFKNENISKKFVVQGIIETGNTMINKDVYCLYNDVYKFYEEYGLKEIIKEFKYDIKYLNNDNYLDEYNKYQYLYAYNPMMDNIVMTKKILTIYSISFFTMILFMGAAYLVLLLNEMKTNNLKKTNYYMKLLLLGISIKTIIKNEIMNFFINFVFVVTFGVPLILFLLYITKLKINWFVIVLSIIYVFITNVLLIIYNDINIRKNGIDYLQKN